MRISIGSGRVRTPSGVEWRVGRQWSPRRLPRWRRVRLGEGGAEQTLDAVWSVPALDVGALEGVELLVGAIMVAVVVAVVIVPMLLFGIELIVAGLVLAAGIVARSMFGRPWVILAIPNANPAAALAWKVRGWRRSARLIEEISTELTAGLTPSPVEAPEQVTPGSG